MQSQLEIIVDQRVRQLISQTLADFTTQLRSVAHHGIGHNSSAAKKPKIDIATLLTDDYLGYADAWVSEKTSDITEVTAISLACLADELANGNFGPLKGQRLRVPPPQKSKCKEQSSTLVAPSSRSDGSSKNGELARRDGANEENPVRSVDNFRKGKRIGGPLKRGSAVQFLKSHDFTRIKSGKEDVFQHRSGQRISLPREHGGKSEIKKGTASKVKKRIVEILGQKVEIVSGNLQ